VPGPVRADLLRLVLEQLLLLARTAATTAVAALGGLLLWTLLPLVAGWDASVVMSGSMSPALRPGDVVLTRDVGPTPVRAGFVVLFQDAAQPRQGTVLHRVVSVADDGALVTQGDANPTPDATAVHPDHVLGMARLRVPWVGTLVLQQRTGRHLELAGTAAVLVVLSAALVAPAGRESPPAGRHRAPGASPR
jgi:signal peptidase